MFNAILIDKDDSGYHANLSTLDEAVLPPGNVTVEVQWSTLNYKDALAITGKGGAVVRHFPIGARHRSGRHRAAQRRSGLQYR